MKLKSKIQKEAGYLIRPFLECLASILYVMKCLHYNINNFQIIRLSRPANAAICVSLNREMPTDSLHP